MYRVLLCADSGGVGHVAVVGYYDSYDDAVSAGGLEVAAGADPQDIVIEWVDAD